MRVIFIILSFVSFLSISCNADDKAAVALRASTLGIGGELAINVNENVNVRVGLYGLKLGRDETADGINYDLKAKLFSTGAMVDYYPGRGTFHLTAGVFYNGNKLEGDSIEGQNLEIGNATYAAAVVGTLHGVVKADKVAPYAGIGWGRTTKGKGRFKFLFDVGVMFHGTPKGELTSNIPSGSAFNSDPALLAAFEENLAEEVAAFQNDVASFKLYPVVSLGVGIKF